MCTPSPIDNESTKRISAIVEATSVWPVDGNLGWIGRVHRRTDTALGYGLRPQEAAVVRGMVLGDRSLIPEELEEAFQRSGITHILLPSVHPFAHHFSARLGKEASEVELTLG